MELWQLSERLQPSVDGVSLVRPVDVGVGGGGVGTGAVVEADVVVLSEERHRSGATPRPVIRRRGVLVEGQRTTLSLESAKYSPISLMVVVIIMMMMMMTIIK